MFCFKGHLSRPYQSDIFHLYPLPDRLTYYASLSSVTAIGLFFLFQLSVMDERMKSLHAECMQQKETIEHLEKDAEIKEMQLQKSNLLNKKLQHTCFTLEGNVSYFWCTVTCNGLLAAVYWSF